MAEESVFRGALSFLNELGVYDVILPFLLVFTIMFAILEKTKILGVEKIGDVDYTKKNLNAMVAFIVGFIVIASSTIVTAIHESMGRIFLLLLVSICFLLLIGSFYHHEEKVLLEGGWRKFFMVVMLIGVVLIFMDSIKLDSGESWLEWLWIFLSNNWAANYTASVILIIIFILAILYITWEKKPSTESKE